MNPGPSTARRLATALFPWSNNVSTDGVTAGSRAGCYADASPRQRDSRVTSEAIDSQGEHGCPVEDLQPGEYIQAWHNGKIYHSGSVVRTFPSLGLVNLLSPDETRVRLIDAEVFLIIKTHGQVLVEL